MSDYTMESMLQNIQDLTFTQLTDFSTNLSSAIAEYNDPTYVDIAVSLVGVSVDMLNEIQKAEKPE